MGGGFRSRDASWHTRRQAGTHSSANNSACAVKEAVKNTCYYGYDVTYWQKSYDFMIGWAHAFARVRPVPPPHACATPRMHCRRNPHALLLPPLVFEAAIPACIAPVGCAA